MYVRAEYLASFERDAGEAVEVHFAELRQTGEEGKAGIRDLQAFIEFRLLQRVHAAENLEAAVGDLRQVIGAGTQIFTRKELEAHETAYWTTRTSVGIIFGSGLLISLVVGIMIVYQIVSTQVGRQLPQFATLKAIGYPDRSLAGTVGAMSLLIVVAGFIRALAAALGLYSVIRQETLLPVTMTHSRLVAVFIAALLMASISALLSIGSLRRADPADVF